MTRFRLISLPGVALAALGLLASGCGSSSTSTGKTTSGAAASVPAPASTQPAKASPSPSAEASIATLRQFVGGGSGKADATKSPVKLGFTTQEGGFLNWPQMREAAQAAVEVVNDQLGGIDGHPVALDVCKVVSSEEQGQQCGQQFVNDPDISTIVEGYLSTGADTFHQAIADKKPVVGALANPAVENTLKNAFYTAGGVNASSLNELRYVTTILHAKSVVFVHQNDPVDTNLFHHILGPQLAKAGVKVTYAPYPANATNLLGPMIAGNTAHADVIMAIPTYPAQCIAIAKALDQLKATAPVLTSTVCENKAVAAGLGDLPKWIYSSFYTSLTDPGSLAPEVKVYTDAMASIGKSADQDENFAPLAFTAAVAAVKFIKQAGGASATPAQVSSAAAKYAGPMFMQPTTKWGVKPYPTTGSLGSRFYKYDGNGAYTDELHDNWMTPTGLLPAGG